MKNCRILFNIVVTLFICMINIGFALEVKEIPVLPVEPKNAYWIFSGLVNDENGQQYGYFFQMERQDTQFHIQTALIDEATNETVFYYDKTEKIDESVDLKWKIGGAFLRFNPINESWVFGVKAEDKGFNFKIDMLNQPSGHAETLRPGLEFIAYQTSRLNGHLKLTKDKKEQFVTAHNAWYSKTWLSSPQKQSHILRNGLCRFMDGSGFYTENIQEADAQRASLAGWRDITGNAVKMSQFVQVEPSADTWTIRLDLPKLEIQLINSLSQDDRLVAGFFKQSTKGFCMFSNQIFG